MTDFDLPPIFRGAEFIDLPDDVLATLDQGAAERLEGVRVAYHASKAADNHIAMLKDRIAQRVERITELQNFMTARFPRPSFMDLWRQSRAS